MSRRTDKKGDKGRASKETGKDAGKEEERRFSARPQQVAKPMERLWKKAFEKRGFTNREILSNWPRIVGETLAARSEPLKLVWKADRDTRQDLGATLHIRVDGAANLEFQHAQPQILSRINSFFGYRAVTGLRLIQAPVIREDQRRRPNRVLSDQARSVISSATNPIENDGLKKALNRLGADIFMAKKQ